MGVWLGYGACKRFVSGVLRYWASFDSTSAGVFGTGRASSERPRLLPAGSPAHRGPKRDRFTSEGRLRERSDIAKEWRPSLRSGAVAAWSSGAQMGILAPLLSILVVLMLGHKK